MYSLQFINICKFYLHLFILYGVKEYVCRYINLIRLIKLIDNELSYNIYIGAGSVMIMCYIIL